MAEDKYAHYIAQKIELGEATGVFYRNNPELEYRIVRGTYGIHIYVTTNAGFPAWQITEEPFETWKQAEDWFAKNAELCDKCEIDRSE